MYLSHLIKCLKAVTVQTAKEAVEEGNRSQDGRDKHRDDRHADQDVDDHDTDDRTPVQVAEELGQPHLNVVHTRET